MALSLGRIAMLGSGETSLAGGRIYEELARALNAPVHIALLETPAGFELNSAQVIGRVGEFMHKRLQNYDPTIDIIPARKRGTPFSPDEPDILRKLVDANFIFMGPGSPTYAVRQLMGSLAWDLVRAGHRQGAALVFASAAMVAVGRFSLPVYEIYKVGQDVHAVPGLDLFSDFGLQLSFIPHWNNTDGGEDVDTSRCFIGRERFSQWCADLPAGHITLGLDEHTGLIIDFKGSSCSVSGVSSATLQRDCDPWIYPAGAVFPLAELGELKLRGDDCISAPAWEMLQVAGDGTESHQLPQEVLAFLEMRRQARQCRDWQRSDEIRLQIAQLGWIVTDTPEGQHMEKDR